MRLVDLPDDVLTLLMEYTMSMHANPACTPALYHPPPPGLSVNHISPLRKGLSLGLTCQALFKVFSATLSSLRLVSSWKMAQHPLYSAINLAERLQRLHIECAAPVSKPLRLLVSRRPPLSSLILIGINISRNVLDDVIHGVGGRLTSLTLAAVNAVDSFIIRSIASACAELRTLHLCIARNVCANSLILLFHRLKKRLQSVELNALAHRSIDDSVLFALAGCSSLVELSLVKLPFISEVGLDRVLRTVGSQLTSLTLESCLQINPSVAHNILSLTSVLRKLHLKFDFLAPNSQNLHYQRDPHRHNETTTVTAPPLQPSTSQTQTQSTCMPPFSELSHLTLSHPYLTLSHPSLTNTFITALFPSLCSLRILNLKRCTCLTDNSLLQLSSAMPHLLSLDISYIPGVTDLGLQQFVSFTPLLTHLYMVGCSGLTDLTLTETIPHSAPKIKVVTLSYADFSRFAVDVLRERNITICASHSCTT